MLDSKGNVVHVLHVRVKRLPNPVALVLGQRSGLMSKGKLKALSRVDAKIENFDFDVPVRVKSFDVMIFSEMDSLVKFSIKGNKITSEVKKQFLMVESGSYIVFDNIKVGLPGGARKVSSIVIRMK